MQEIVPLIHRAQSGDAEAYGTIVSRFQDMAYGYAYAILNDFHLAQDAAQEAFIEAYRCLPNLQEPYAFPAWFKRIVYKHCDRLTRSKRPVNAPLEAVTELASPLPGPPEMIERNDMARQVQQAISELPVNQRVVTTLFYINGYSHQEIADFLEVPAKTVKSRLHTSRGKLRERMIGMVEDELKANALPDNFTQETVDQAVKRAGELNRDHKYNEAEDLLHKVLEQAPQHPEALKELNRALMHGRVYNQSRWDMLPKLVDYGRTILQTVDDEYVHHEIARTLLAIPAMPEAIAFIKEWIEKKGPNLERLGMLAWAKANRADYDTAEALWNEVLALAPVATTDEVLFHIPFIAYTLVDCFTNAGDLPRAQRIAQQAWDYCRDLRKTNPEIAAQLKLHRGFPADSGWLAIFHQAKLDIQPIASDILEAYRGDTSPTSQATVLCVRSWTDDIQAVIADWLDWVRERAAAGEMGMIENYGFAILRGPSARGDWRASMQLAQGTWELLIQSDTPQAQRQLEYWDCQRTDPWGAIQAKDWTTAENIAKQHVEKYGIQSATWQFVNIATFQGLPVPPEVMRAIEQKDPERYEFIDWYAVARESAAIGNEDKAFSALRKALSQWTNPPYGIMNDWEADPYWGELRSHPEFKRAFEERRQRIGPIRGLLHYFPGW